MKILVRCPTIILLTAGKALTIVIWLYKVRQRDVYHPIEAAAVRFSCTSVWREKKKSSFLFFFIMLLIMTIERKSTKGANCSNPSHRRQKGLIPRHAHTWKVLSLQCGGFVQFSSAGSAVSAHWRAGHQHHF